MALRGNKWLTSELFWIGEEGQERKSEPWSWKTYEGNMLNPGVSNEEKLHEVQAIPKSRKLTRWKVTRRSYNKRSENIEGNHRASAENESQSVAPTRLGNLCQRWLPRWLLCQAGTPRQVAWGPPSRRRATSSASPWRWTGVNLDSAAAMSLFGL